MVQQMFNGQYFKHFLLGFENYPPQRISLGFINQYQYLTNQIWQSQEANV